MSHARAQVAAVLLAALIVSASVASAQVLPVTYPPIAGNVAVESSLIIFTNDARRAAGAQELAYHEALSLAARHHAREMVELGYRSHESPVPENRTIPQRVIRAGAAIRMAAENIWVVADDVSAARNAVAAWLERPNHATTLLDDRFTHVGFGVAPDGNGGLVVVQLLGYVPLDLVSARAETSGGSVRVHLTFARVPDATYGVWVDDRWTSFDRTGNTVSFMVPGGDVHRLEVGLEHVPGEPYILAIGLSLTRQGGGYSFGPVAW